MNLKTSAIWWLLITGIFGNYGNRRIFGIPVFANTGFILRVTLEYYGQLSRRRVFPSRVGRQEPSATVLTIEAGYFD